MKHLKFAALAAGLWAAVLPRESSGAIAVTPAGRFITNKSTSALEQFRVDSGSVTRRLDVLNMLTLTASTASLPVQTNASKALVTTPIDLSGAQSTGTLAPARFPALAGDVTTSSGSLVTTLGATIPNAHTFSGVVTFSTGRVAGLTAWKYRRPNLQWVSITTVDVEGGLTGTSGERVILFPDGDIRTITSSTMYRFDISRNCALSGTKQSGLRASLSEATNTWYAIYAVKASDNATDWVAAGDTVLPLQANYATLNSNFGTNGWVYLGMIRNGDNSGATGDILNFIQSGNQVGFSNEVTAAAAMNQSGIRLATTAGATSLTYTYAAGTGAAQIPDHLAMGMYAVSINGGGSSTLASFTQQAVSTIYYARIAAGGATTVQLVATSGLAKLITGAIGAVNVGGAMDIFLRSYVDSVLGVGSNPQI